MTQARIRASRDDGDYPSGITTDYLEKTELLTIISGKKIPLQIESGIVRQDLSGKRGSNSRPSAWQADALPTELFPQRSLKRRQK